MTIVYCDWATGDDTTGDGSSGNPYKTITKASTGLTGSDEVRVGKSAAPTALTGTLGFTAGSTAVTGSSTLFTSELVIGDFIEGYDSQWYEVVTITDNTNAVLFKVYPSATQSGVSSNKLGVTSTGEAAASSTAIQTASASGSSAVSRLKISGGWDLGTTTQDGQTWFRQMHGTFATRYGRGLYASSKDYIEIDHLHFLRYDNCVYKNSCDYWKVTGLNALSAGDEAYYLDGSHYNELISCVFNSSADQGLYLNYSSNNTFTSLVCNSCGWYNQKINYSRNNIFTDLDSLHGKYGVSLYNSPNNDFTDLNGSDNSGYGCYLDHKSYGCDLLNPVLNDTVQGVFSRASFTKVVNPDCNNNTDAFLFEDSLGSVVNNFAGTGNTNDVVVTAGKHFSEEPVLKMQHFNTTGDNRCYYEYGVTYSDSTDHRTTAPCLKYDPSSATYYISQSFHFKADSGVAQTLSAYIKDDASFNGDVQAAIYFMGEKITGWTAWVPTTSYVKHEIIAAAGSITENGVLELRIKVRGTAGLVFCDSLGTAA